MQLLIRMKKLQQEVQKYLKERKWDNLRPSDIAKSIVIEAAELLEKFQWLSETKEETKADIERFEEIKEELADVVIYALDMAIMINVDLEELVNKKLERAKQKYPAELFANIEQDKHGNSKEYWQIKKAHRNGTKK